jgi:O-methyltransferase
MATVYELWYSDIGDTTILNFTKFFNIYKAVIDTQHLEGDTAEIGVFTGSTSKLIHYLTPNKTHYCYDTFCGIKGSDKNIDYHTDGEFSCSLETVKKYINMDNVIYKVGYFPDTFYETNNTFSLVHSDTDTYIGTKNTLIYFSKRMVPGGKIIFDDYKWRLCPGVEKAILEFKQQDTEFIHEELFDESANIDQHQYILTKRI